MMPHSDRDPNHRSRRTFLCWLASASVVGIAGCQGEQDDGSPTETSTASPTEEATDTPTEPRTETPTETPPEAWPMYCHDRANTGYNEATTGPKDAVEPRWEFQTSGKVRSSPAVIGGTVYIGSTDGTLYALDTGTGTEVWAFDTGAPIVSSPAVSGDTVYVGSNDHTVYALARETGEIQWEFQTGGKVRSSPAVAETFEMATEKVLAIGSDDGIFYILDAPTGEKLYEVSTDGQVVSTPTLYDGVFRQERELWYVCASTAGVRFGGAASRSGYRNDDTWEAPFRTEYDAPIYSSVTTPTTEPDDGFLALLGTDDGSLYKVDEGVDDDFQFETGGEIRTSPALAYGLTFFGSWDHSVYAVDIPTGEEEWAFETGGKVESSPAIADGAVYVGSDDHNVYALDHETGEVYWTYESDGAVRSSPAVVDGTVYVGSNDTTVYALAEP